MEFPNIHCIKAAYKFSATAIVACLAAGLPGTAPAQPEQAAPFTKPPLVPAPAGSAGPVNERLRQQSPEFNDWDIGGVFRLRYADSVGAVAAASTLTGPRPPAAGGKPLTIPPLLELCSRQQKRL